MKQWFFTVEEEGSMHESRYFKTKKECKEHAQRYVNDYKNYSYPDTLKIESVDL